MKPLEDRLHVEVMDRDKTTPGGIIIPEREGQDDAQRLERGKVVSAGPGYYTQKGAWIPTNCRPGDVVIFGAWMGDGVLSRKARPVDMEPGDLVSIRERECLAVDDGAEEAA